MQVLYAEHLALEAEFDGKGLVRRYPCEDSWRSKGRTPAVFLSDVSHLRMLLFSGDDAPMFATSAFAGRKLGLGECSFEAVLTGDGKVASIPLLARTGTFEYVSIDLSSRAEVLEAWLSFLSGVSQGEYQPYGNMATEDVTSSHTILALYGEGARTILQDYAKREELPRQGEIASCPLDRIPCILARPQLTSGDMFLILVPPALSAVLWRSLLSFPEVEPVGTKAFADTLSGCLDWYSLLETSGTIQIQSQKLRQYGVVRPQPDFVGARGLDNE